MKQEGNSTKAVMDTLNIKNNTQIKRLMKWYNQEETYRFNQPIGKQYRYNKGLYEYSKIELLKLENRQLKARLEILAKFQEIQRK